MQSYFMFIFMCLAMELTPGPNMSYLIIVALKKGRKQAFYCVMGIALGLSLSGLLSAIGFGNLIRHNRILFETLRWSGIAYLFWLAFDGLYNASKKAPKTMGSETTAEKESVFAEFRAGLITNLLNPKAYLFYLGTLPSFIDPNELALAQTLWLSVTYIAIASAIHLSLVFLAETLRQRLEATISIKWLNQILSLSLILVAVWLIYATQLKATP